MKKRAIFAALLAVLVPTLAMADTCQRTTSSGNIGYSGAVTAANLNPAFTAYEPPMEFCNGCSGFTPLQFNIITDQSLQGSEVNTNSGFAGIPISGISISCTAFNASLIASANYPYSADTNGIAGGTVTVKEYPATGAATTVGTVVLPSSPHGGPYISSATSTLSSPYTPSQHSTFSAYISAYNATPSNSYTNCVVSLILQ